MAPYRFVDLVDIEQIRLLLEAHYRVSGVLSAIMDTEENILVAVGWQDICTRFHRIHPGTCARCRESDAYIKAHLSDFTESYLEYRCKNGLREIAMPIIIDGNHLATLFTGQFFYDDEEPDIDFFRAQADEFGFDTESYLAALGHVPRCSRENILHFLEYYRNLVSIMAELGQKNVNLAREVQSREKAEASWQEMRDRLDKIINTVADPVFVKDREHRYVLANDAACVTAGLHLGDIVGRTDYDLFPKEEAAVIWAQDEVVLHSEQVHVNEEEITDAQGTRRVFVAKKRLYRDHSGKKYIVGVVRDITDLKQKEMELRVINAELETRVAQRTSELASLNAELLREIEERKKAEEEIKVRQRQLEELNETLEKRVEKELAENRAKDIMLIQQNRQAALGEMLDHIAHQWKQPINTIALVVQNLGLSSSCGHLSDEDVKEAVHKTLDLLDHMAQTIEVFRDFYRPQKEKRIFRVEDAVDMALELIAPTLVVHAIAVEVEVDPGLVASGYSKEFAQVLLNLLGNAKDALTERTVATPRIGIKGFSAGAMAVVAVTDNAGGISQENLDKIFQPHFTTREAVGGSGMGLYMSKSIIEGRMGGTISVSNVGGGAEFRIAIPVS